MSINQPGLTDVHVNRPLSTIVVAHQQSDELFVASRVFPGLNVKSKTDSYFVIPPGEFFSDRMKKRAPGTLSAERSHATSTTTYECDVWAVHEMLADQVLANYDSPLQAEREISMGLSLAGMIRKEIEWRDTYFTTSVWSVDQTGVNSSPTGDQFLQWDDPASTPIEDIRAGKRRILARSGYSPNKMVLGREVFDQLLDHPDIVGRLDRGQTTGVAMVQRDALAALFELDEILVMDAVVNTAAEGATATIGFIGTKSALLIYAAPAPGLYTPSAGYTFNWSEYVGVGGMGTVMRRIRDDDRRATKIEIEMSFALKLVAADLGQFFATAVA